MADGVKLGIIGFMAIIASQRHLFDIPADIAFFNCAYYAPQLRESEHRLIVGARAKSHPWQRATADFFDDAETIRRLAAECFGGDAEGYAIIPAASYGMSTAARAVETELRPGDRLLVMAEEFPSGVFAWQRAAQETGASLVTVPYPADGNWTQAILERIQLGAKVASLSTCHWTNGAYLDLAAIGQVCRAQGTLLVVDATQSLGAMPFPLREVQPDFLIAAGYKWLLGPYGFGLLYVSERCRTARPLEESWLARENARDFAGLANYCPTYQPGARRFEVGEKGVDTLLPGAIAALEQIKAWGVPHIAETLAAINGRIADHLAARGFHIPPASQCSPHMFGARLPHGGSPQLVAELKARGIYVSQRGDAIRFAPHLHINDADVARLLAALDELTGNPPRTPL